MVEPNLKEVVKAMCSAYPGGRSAMAGALGMTLTQFNNNLYEKNGCRFFEYHEVEAMEEFSNTNYLAEYHATRRNKLLVDKANPAEIDSVELHHVRLQGDINRGKYDQKMQDAMADGVIDAEEEKVLWKKLDRYVATKTAELIGFLSLYGIGKGPKG